MHPTIRRVFPFAAAALALAALTWAVSFGTLPPADFTFANGDFVKTIDPPKATGAPEGRVINALFEGLYRNHPKGLVIEENGDIKSWPVPDADGNVPMEPVPAIAESCEISPDGKTYTFKIRPGAKWSDGSPVTAHDFVFSWQRMLHPETASRYAYQLTAYVVGAANYNTMEVKIGDRVEVELADRKDAFETFPRGTIRKGILRQIARPPKPALSGKKEDKEDDDNKEAEWRDAWVYLVEVKPGDDGQTDWDAEGSLRAFSREAPESLAKYEIQRSRENDEQEDANSGDRFSQLSQRSYAGEFEPCVFVLPDFETVGIKAPDQQTLVVTLMNRTPFFLDLVAFYPLFPVNRKCVEKFGTPKWTKPENIVTNGPFLLKFRRIRDRVRMVKNPTYWDATVVKLNIVDALEVKSQTTMLNLYLNDQCDWITDVPNALIPELRQRNDFHRAPQLATYFYRLNVNKPPLDDVHVRRALNMAIDKQLICEKVAKSGEIPATSYVPPGLANYRAQAGPAFDAEAAKQELRKSKYFREGKTLPKIEILYNTHQNHRAIAEVIQQQWKNNLGIDVGLRNSEWATFLDDVHQMKYLAARAGWIGDYADPNTFLDMWVTGGENNETGWSNAEYDRLIKQAASEPDMSRRLRQLERAEAILMDEQPILPIYFYVAKNMAHARVQGFFANIQDLHPLHLLRVEGR